MNRLRFLHSMALAALAMLSITSCSEEQEVGNVSLSKDAIRFSVVDANGTRSAMDSRNFRKELKGFFVNAFPDNAIHEPYMNDVEFINDGNGNFMYKKDKDIKFWPDYPLSFVAMNAHDALGTKLEMSQQGDIGLGVFTGGENDIVAAYVPNQSKLMNNGEVFLQFHHLLSQIKFYVEDRSTSRLDCEISRIGLKGVYDDAFFFIDQQGNVTTSMGPSGYACGDYTIDVQDYDPDQEPVLMNNGKDIFIVPMNHKSWDPKSGVRIKDINDAMSNDDNDNIYSYVWMECKVKKDGKYVVGDENSYGHTYFPFRANLKAGKIYNYIIRISNDFYGYTDETESVQEPQLGRVITDKGNIYRDSQSAIIAGENPVAMIAYIDENGNGPGPWHKHGLAISLKVLDTKKTGRIYDMFFSLSELQNWNYWVNKSIGNEPNWTQWYVPSCKDFDLIFDACGGTKYSSSSHTDNQPWDYGELEGLLEETDPPVCTPAECHHQYMFPFATQYYWGYNDKKLGTYWIRQRESSFVDDVIVYDAVNKKYKSQGMSGTHNMIRLVFRF